METVTSTEPRLRRSTSDKVIGGVCGGLGAYFQVDPIWFRIAFVALAFGGGSGVLLYLIALIAIPEEDEDHPIVARPDSGNAAGVIVGSVLIVLGMIALAREFVPWLDDVIWPLALIAIGTLLVARRFRS